MYTPVYKLWTFSASINNINKYFHFAAFTALGVVLSISMVVIIALLINTYRLNRKIQKLASPRNDGQLVQQVFHAIFYFNINYRPIHKLFAFEL